MKNLIVFLSALILIASSCTKQRIADVVIRYEVEASNPNRSFSMYYANTTFGEDVARDISSTIYFYEFSIPSDETPQEYYMSVECPEDRTTNAQQLITTRIYENGKLIIERFTGGSSDIIENRTFVSAFLPTKIVMEEY